MCSITPELGAGQFMLQHYTGVECKRTNITIVHPLWSRVSVLVFNATFKSISAILWLSVLLVEKTGITDENLS